MLRTNPYLTELLRTEPGCVIWRAGKPTDAQARGDAVVLTVPFYAQTGDRGLKRAEVIQPRVHELHVQALGGEMIRLSAGFDGSAPAQASEMLQFDPSLRLEPLTPKPTETGWDILDARGRVRLRINTAEPKLRVWSEFIAGGEEAFDMTVFPDGEHAAEFMAHDDFGPQMTNSLPLAYVDRPDGQRWFTISMHARGDEKFAGTGERFARMDLSGQTLALENIDAAGTNNRGCYKNIPFYLTSRPYGLFVHTSAHLRFSLADYSTRAAITVAEDGAMDLFFVGGPSLERIVYNYRRLTGFPAQPPLWSYGTWMSRMTYFSADEVRTVARRMREGEFPCDVLHVDTGWFEIDWQCTWRFGDRFPDTEKFLREMRDQGFRITLWQMPFLWQENPLFAELKAKGFFGTKDESAAAAQAGVSSFAAKEVGYLDFSNPAVVEWYQAQLRRLLKMGVSAIKTDFGEEVDLEAKYYGMPAAKLHNLYALLYQKAAFEVTTEVTGEGIIWARSSWAGSQRYPLHWGGDTACTWDGLYGTIRGGLHLGLSGFAFWSHDVPGFTGVPNFMNAWPDDDLYVRWTQVGVLSSHLRYHGGQPREPYEYPAIADTVRKWLRLRYALIPYLLEEAKKATRSGLPILRAMVFHHEGDPACWHIDDQFYCGDSLLVAPILNSEGRRDVYLPEGEWVDIWTGEAISGPRLLKGVEQPLERMPLYAVKGATIRVYPHRVQSTAEMDLAQSVELTFDDSFRGLSQSVLGQVTGL